MNKRSWLLLLFLFISLFVYADVQDLINKNQLESAMQLLQETSEQNPELWRKLGFLFKRKSNFESAIFCYEQIIQKNSEDYDARLALGRLYLENNQPEKAIFYFNKIKQNDKSDVEAYLGLARTYKALGKYNSAIENYHSALQYLPKYMPALFELAQVFSYDNQLQSAINTYKMILQIDDTYAEAYAGIGRMFWWKNQPFAAKKYYQKAIGLDPTNDKIKAEMQKVEQEFNWQLSAKYSAINESEEGYEINTFQQNYHVKKRVFDFLTLKISGNYQYAQKEENDFITERYFDANTLKSSFILGKNRLNCLIGASVSDSTLTLSELSWQTDFSLKSFQISNSMGIGEKYFYFWQRARKQYYQNSGNINWKKFNLSANYQIGEVKKNWIGNQDTKIENPYLNYNINLQYKLFVNPQILLNGSYRFMDYMYDSSLYYSPSNRKIYGFSGSIYYPFSSFYFYGSGGIFRDNSEDIESNFDAEIGWNFFALSLSAAFSSFNNVYYQSQIFSLIVGGNF